MSTFSSVRKMNLLTYISIRYFLSERFRLRMEDVFMDELGEEEKLDEAAAEAQGANSIFTVDGASALLKSVSKSGEAAQMLAATGEIRTLDGKLVGDEFAADAINYQVLLDKIDALLDKLKLEA